MKWVDRFRDVPVLVVGDLMVDRAYRGSAERISPEAPVPVVHVAEESALPGGAGNVVNNLAVLGAKPSLIAICGEDAAGDDIRVDLSNRGVNVSGVLVDPARPTITKTRVFAGHQQVARFDLEKRGIPSEEVLEQICEALRVAIPNHKAVVLSDYGKGVVNPHVIRLCLAEARKRNIPIVVDPKIEHFWMYKGVDCITPNTKEAIEGARANVPRTEAELIALGERVLSRLKSRSLLITRGEKGMSLFQPDKKPDTIPALAQEVYDVTGAGDTVVATFSLARAVGAPHPEAARIANVAASIVVGKVGTAVATPRELADRIASCV